MNSLDNLCYLFSVTMPHKKTVTRSAAPSPSKGKELVEDQHMEDVEEQEEENASDNSNNSDSSDNLYEESEDDNEDVAPDESQFIGPDLSTIKSEQYTILRHINQFRFPRSATLSMFHSLCNTLAI